MVKNEEFSKAEELSQCLDSLNDGKRPAVQNEEIKEFVDLAVLVKQSYQQEELPRVLIDEVVDNLAAEFQAKKQKRRNYWLYSGFAGAAAAVVIAAFAQFLLPPTGDHNIAQEINNPMETPKMVAVADQSMSPQPAQSEVRVKTPTVVPIEEKSTTSLSKVIEEIIKAPESPKKEQEHNQVAILQEEILKEMTLRKSVPLVKSSINSLQAEASIQPEDKMIRMMVIPNQVPRSIRVDATSGDIKQIYHLDNHDEVVITQGLYDESKGVQPLIPKTKDGINSVTMKVDKYNIKIEGKKTWKELQQIAESLIEKDVKQ